jgi:hypothetical protein
MKTEFEKRFDAALWMRAMAKAIRDEQKAKEQLAKAREILSKRKAA